MTLESAIRRGRLHYLGVRAPFCTLLSLPPQIGIEQLYKNRRRESMPHSLHYRTLIVIILSRARHALESFLAREDDRETRISRGIYALARYNMAAPIVLK